MGKEAKFCRNISDFTLPVSGSELGRFCSVQFSKVGHRMAQSEFENEPDFVLLGSVGTFDSDLLTSNLESSVIEQSLSDVAALISLGDTNISVPGH